MNINIFEEVEIPLNIEEVADFAECICQKEKIEADINIIFIDNENMRSMNSQYRGKDYPTDVLSFNYGDMGEIYICPQIAKKNAKENGVSYYYEILNLIAHGLLHIKGYTHETMEKYERMMSLQKEYINLCYH